VPSPIDEITTLKPFVHKNENRIFFSFDSAWHLKATCKTVWRPNLGQKFQHKSEEFFDFGLGDVGLGLWSGMASAPSGRPVHRHA
jgi:hypothetical protein